LSILQLTESRHFISISWCIYWFLSISGVHAENADIVSDKRPIQESRAKNQLLSPLTIDDRYLRKEIPAEDSKGTITLHGAVTEAAAHNKEVEEARLQISRFERIDETAPEMRKIIFDPIPRVDGIDPSDDPLIAVRSAIYLLSGRRHRATEI
jgi:hypothetical protein